MSVCHKLHMASLDTNPPLSLSFLFFFFSLGVLCRILLSLSSWAFAVQLLSVIIQTFSVIFHIYSRGFRLFSHRLAFVFLHCFFLLSHSPGLLFVVYSIRLSSPLLSHHCSCFYPLCSLASCFVLHHRHSHRLFHSSLSF